MMYNSQAVYNGEWLEGERSGHGVLTYADQESRSFQRLTNTHNQQLPDPKPVAFAVTRANGFGI